MDIYVASVKSPAAEVETGTILVVCAICQLLLRRKICINSKDDVKQRVSCTRLNGNAKVFKNLSPRRSFPKPLFVVT